MKEEIENLEFTLTRSMTYTLFKLSKLLDKRNELLSNTDVSSRELSRAIRVIDKEIADLKKEFVSEFREENFEKINYYWYLRSKE